MVLWHTPPFCSFAVPSDVTVIDNLTTQRDIPEGRVFLKAGGVVFGEQTGYNIVKERELSPLHQDYFRFLLFCQPVF